MTNPEPSDLISRRTAADMVAVNPKTIYRWERQGRLQAFKLTCRSTRYRLADVLKLIAEARVNAVVAL